MTSDHAIFERTHVLGASELHGNEKASNALLSGQWSENCFVRGHLGLGRSDQRQFRALTSLFGGRFERKLVWSGEIFQRTLFWSKDVLNARWSDQRKFRTHLIRGQFKRNLFWSEDVLSALRSDQKTFGTHFNLTSGRFERTMIWSEDVSSALYSDKRWGPHKIRTHKSLIWGPLERIFFWTEDVSNAW